MNQRFEIDLRKNPEVKRIIVAADPSYRKHKATIVVADSVTLHGTYWDGGSRSTYTAVNMINCQSAGAPQYAPPQYNGPQTTPVVTIPENVAIVKTGTFCGKPASAAVYVRSSNATKFLPGGI